jgi:hypothetical protein
LDLLLIDKSVEGRFVLAMAASAAASSQHDKGNNSNSGSGDVDDGPYYTSYESISSSQSSMSIEEQLRVRREQCSFIAKMAQRLRFPMRTMATACVLFHRYYMRHSLSLSGHGGIAAPRYERHEVAAASLFLACKIEESPRKVGEVAEQMYVLTWPDIKYVEDSVDASRIRDNMIACEASLLDATDYCFSFIHPHHITMLLLGRAYGSAAVTNSMVINMAQTSWILCNESLRSPLCLLYRPQAIAIAVLVMAAHYHRQSIPHIRGNTVATSGNTSGKPWWSSIAPQLDEGSVHAMTLYILDNATPNGSNGGTPSVLTQLRNDSIISIWRASSFIQPSSLVSIATHNNGVSVGPPVMSSLSISTSWTGASALNDDHLLSSTSSALSSATSSTSASPYIASVAVGHAPYVATAVDTSKNWVAYSVLISSNARSSTY